MNQNALAIISLIFGPIWRMFTSWHIPGTNITPAAMGVFIVFFGLVVRYIHRLLLGVHEVDTTKK